MTEKLSELIARDIFVIGDEKDSPTQRLRFMGGEYPDNEKNQGGLCEQALAKAIEKSLKKNLVIRL